MTVIAAQSNLATGYNDLAVPLPLYAQIIGYQECQFFGVRDDNAADYACRKVWLKSQRDEMAYYLAEAQDEIEQHANYYLKARWTTNEDKPYSYPVLTDWRKVIAGGIKATEDISTDEAVSHLTDPAVIGPVATTVTDESEIHVFYPESLVEEEVEIHPSDIDLDTVGGTVTIYVPRCRMVKPSLVDNDESGLDYDDTTNFLSVVDVKRVYNDTSTNATLVWPNSCGCGSIYCPTCSEYTHDGCIYVLDSGSGSLRVLEATYSSGSWSACTTCRTQPRRVKLNYYSGLTSLTRQARDAIVRLAHAKMPHAPCGCDVAQNMWVRDRTVPDVVTRERINCPFGISNGAWAAWQFANDIASVGLGVI